jgi:hydroxymethylglutaryl-CoA lyase
MNIPKSVEIIEVGPRDGFQGLPEIIPTEIKIKLISRLIQCGFKKIEVTSFVSQKRVPQMADAEKVLSGLKEKGAHSGVKFLGLVANLKGASRAADTGIDGIRFVISVSEQHNLSNTGQTVKESLAQMIKIREAYPNLYMEVLLATSFGCSIQGSISHSAVLNLSKNILQYGIDKIGLSDTIGFANPLQVYKLLTSFREEFPSVSPILHFHDTAGMGLANVWTSMQLGFGEFDSSVGGLGGCQFAPGAAGNISSEGLNHMLLDMGITTNISQTELQQAVSMFKTYITK